MSTPGPIRINDQDYTFDITMYSFGDEETSIPSGMINNLIIEEEMWTSNTTGYIELISPHEVLERGFNDKNDFYIRNDTFTLLKIHIKQLDEKGEPLEPKNHWEKHYRLAIVHIEDDYDSSPSENETSKIKKRRYYFEDQYFNLLKSMNVDYGRGYSAFVKKGDVEEQKQVKNRKFGQTDERNSTPASDVIAGILTTVSRQSEREKPDKPKDTKIKVSGKTAKSGESEEEGVSKLGMIDAQRWGKMKKSGGGKGQCTDKSRSRIIFNAPNNWSAMDCIQYALIHCVHETTKEPCIFHRGWTEKERAKGWKLEPISFILNESYHLHYEKFFITDANYPLEGDEDYKSESGEKLYAGQYETKQSEDQHSGYHGNGTKSILNFYDHSTNHIKQYAYNHASPREYQYITNKVLHSYDFRTHGLRWIKSGSDIQKTHKFLKKQWLWQEDGCLNLSISKIQTEGWQQLHSNVYKHFNYENFPLYSSSLHFIIHAPKLNFEVDGQLFRRPQQYFSVDRDSFTAKNNVFDKQLLGEWFINKITHVWSQGTFKQIIQGTRSYMRGKKIPEGADIKNPGKGYLS